MNALVVVLHTYVTAIMNLFAHVERHLHITVDSFAPHCRERNICQHNVEVMISSLYTIVYFDADHFWRS